MTAGARPPIGVAGARGASRQLRAPFESPWTVTLGLVFRIELGGKRGARIAAAQARALVAELQARVVAWNIASDVRTAALTVVQGDSSVAAWTRRVGRSEQVAEPGERLYESDAVGQSTVDQATAEARLAGTGARGGGRAGDRRPCRAGAPASACPRAAIDTLAIATRRSRRVRLDRAAEPRGRCAPSPCVAATRWEWRWPSTRWPRRTSRSRSRKQYPDLELAPGYSWDQGLHRWIAALGAARTSCATGTGARSARRSRAGTRWRAPSRRRSRGC